MSAYRGECFKITFEGYTRLIKISGARHLLPSAGTHYGNLLGSVLDGQKVGGGGRSQVPNGGGTAQHQKLQEQTSFGEGSSEGLKKLILETIVSVGVVVTVQVPVPGGVVDLTQVEVHALLTVFGTDNSNPAQ